MNVNKYFELKTFTNDLVVLSGYLVLIDKRLVLIDVSDIDNFKMAAGIEVVNQAIKYVLQESLLPLGGESSIFHKAEVTGVVGFVDTPTMQVQKIQVQERGCADWVEVDLSDERIEQCRAKNEPNEEFDFFKEMGD